MDHQTIIHLSDLHLSKRGKPEATQFRLLTAFIQKNYPGCPIVVTGDVTNSATRSQMKFACQLLRQLAETNLVLAVPGNHDICASGAFHRWKGPMHWAEILGTPLGPSVRPRRWMSVEEEPFGMEGIGVLEHGICTFVGLDSSDPQDAESLARGLIRSDQAYALRKILTQHREKVRVVMLHHHPFTDDYFLGLAGSQRLMSALRGECELLLFGHGHRIGAWWGRHQIPLILASHKSTRPVTRSQLLVSVIQIRRDPDGVPEFTHCLKVV